MTGDEIIKFLAGYKWPLSDEKRLQAEIASKFEERGVAAEREVRLSPTDIIDFMIGTTALEVKIKGSKREIYRQIVRYCEHERVQTLIVATNVALGLPDRIAGKTVRVALLSRGWL